MLHRPHRATGEGRHRVAGGRRSSRSIDQTMARLQGSTGRPLGSGEDHHLRVRRRNTRLCLTMQRYCGSIVCDNPIKMVKRVCMLEQLSSSARLGCSGQILRDLSGQLHRELGSGNFSCQADMKELPDKHSAERRAVGRAPASQWLRGTTAGHERGAEPRLFWRRACWPQEGSHLRL